MDKLDNAKPVFVIFDSKAGFYKSPFICRSRGEAVRGFSDLANDKQTEIGRHPEDFVLYQVAKFDDERGVYENVDHVCLGKAIEFVEQKS